MHLNMPTAGSEIWENSILIFNMSDTKVDFDFDKILLFLKALEHMSVFLFVLTL